MSVDGSNEGKMRRLVMVAMAILLVAGCSTHHAAPASLYPGTAAPASSAPAN